MPTKPLGSPFALGHTAEVYAWEEGYILKLFHEWFPLSSIEHEARMARVVHNAGLPVPNVRDIVEAEGRYGLVYERVIGTSMLEVLSSKPWRIFKYAHLLAELHASMHTIEAVPSLPSQHRKLRRKIQHAEMLPCALQGGALRMLEELPEGNQLCHGDFHADNVLMTSKGPVIIDWIDATRGNPMADVARSSLLMSKAHIPDDKPLRWLLNLFRELFHRAYLRHYFQLRPGGREELSGWRIVNAAGRLSERIPEEEVLLDYVQASLQQ